MYKVYSREPTEVSKIGSVRLQITYSCGLILFLMFMGISSACISAPCAWCSGRPEENIRSPGTELQRVVSHHVSAGRAAKPCRYFC